MTKATDSDSKVRIVGVQIGGRKITFAEMRSARVRGLLVYCADYNCSHSIAISGDHWPDDPRLSDIEGQFVCKAYGNRGAEVRPDFNWYLKPGE